MKRESFPLGMRPTTAAKMSAIIGQSFGRWTVVGLASKSSGRERTRLICRCACGTERTVAVHLLRNGESRSCGCLMREVAARSVVARSSSHGLAKRGAVHPLYFLWSNMKQRRVNQRHHKYADYGGRGITVCERWQKFPAFLADMGERPSDDHSLERIDNDGNYEPGNVRWATRAEQARNRRPRRRT